MEELSIKVTIANRVYPLKIKREDEERVRKAAKMVNDRIKEYEQQYAVADKFDLIAMYALQISSEFLQQTENLPQEREEVKNGISEINSRLTDYLKSNNVL